MRVVTMMEQPPFKPKFAPYYSPAWTKKEAEWHAVMALFLPAMHADRKEFPLPEGWWDAWHLAHDFLNRTVDEAHGRKPYVPEKAASSDRPKMSWTLNLTERYEAIDYNEYHKLHPNQSEGLGIGVPPVRGHRDAQERNCDAQVCCDRDAEQRHAWLGRVEVWLASLYVSARNWFLNVVRFFVLDNHR